jgi:hypothetical protein
VGLTVTTRWECGVGDSGTGAATSFRPILDVAFLSVFHGLYVSIDRRFEWPLQSESCRKQWSVVTAS